MNVRYQIPMLYLAFKCNLTTKSMTTFVIHTSHFYLFIYLFICVVSVIVFCMNRARTILEIANRIAPSKYLLWRPTIILGISFVKFMDRHVSKTFQKIPITNCFLHRS